MRSLPGIARLFLYMVLPLRFEDAGIVAGLSIFLKTIAGEAC
jgi:hypothetical protein